MLIFEMQRGIVGDLHLMPVLAEYVRSYPEVCLDVRYSERFVNLVEEGIELAIRIGKLEASTLVARRLGTVSRYLVATPAYLRDHPAPRTPGTHCSKSTMVPIIGMERSLRR